MSLAWFLSLNKRFFFIAMSFLETSKYDLVKHFISVEDGLGIFFFSVYYDFTKNGAIYAFKILSNSLPSIPIPPQTP